MKMATADGAWNASLLTIETDLKRLITTPTQNMNEALIHIGDGIFLQTKMAQMVATIFVWIALFVTGEQIYQHLRWYTKPQEQRLIVRILFIVPIYALYSWISLMLFDMEKVYIYFFTIRDCYEAYAIYSFLSLCYEYLDGEGCIMDEILDQPVRAKWSNATCCLKGRCYSLRFVRFCKQATLQFCFVKPISAFVVIILQVLGYYHDGDWNVGGGYIYITVIDEISITVALYGLFMFYTATQHMLQPYKPLLKFVVIKSIIFLTYWQGVGMAILEKFEYISAIVSDDGYVTSAGTVAAGYQNLLMCLELFFAAIALRFAFPYEDYMARCLTTDTYSDRHFSIHNLSVSFQETLSPADIMKDAVHSFHPQYLRYTQFRSEDKE